MSLNSVPSSERLHIGFFGNRNAGKSKVVNAITNQELSVVSKIKGTTTDPVTKAMELAPIGPVVIIDTPGIDDEGELGEQRIKRTKQILAKTDIAVLVIDGVKGKNEIDDYLITLFDIKKIPYLMVYNKADLYEEIPEQSDDIMYISAKTGFHIEELKERIAGVAGKNENDKKIIGDLLTPMDVILIVVPIDKGAPKGRLILPQQQTLRDVLDAHAISIVVRETQVKDTIERLKQRPKLVITDSQVFQKVSEDTPEDIMLTSFSILFARYKGDLTQLVMGAKVLDELQDGDQVLISEGCTHHRQCDDIGTVKLPKWVKEYTKKDIGFSFTSGADYKEDLSCYRLIIHCGGCMLNNKEMKSRLEQARKQNTKVTNYGVAIAQMHGILKRSVEIFPDVYNLL